MQLRRVLRATTKAAVAPLSSIWGAVSNVLARPLRGGGFFGLIREPYAGAWQQGVSVDSMGELTANGAVFACISRIATDIAKLRLRLVEQQDDGTWSEVRAPSPFWPVLRRPNRYQNRIQFFAYWLTSKLLFGNAYGLKVRDSRGVVFRIHPIDPRLVTPLVTPQGDVYYQLAASDLAGISSGVTIPASEIIHDRGVTLFHPLCGIPPLYACAIAATQGNRIQANSAKFFENMSRPSGMLTGPGTIEQETADRLKRDWEANYSGRNLGRLAVLGDGLKYEAMTIPPEQAQLVEQLGWTVEDIARAYAVPLYKISAGPMPTNNNVQALEQQYYSGCLQINIEAIELCFDEGLGLTEVEGKTLGVEFDLDGLLRMDTATQLEALAKGTGAGIMAPNEARRRINLPPVTGGEAPLLQQQNWSLAQLAKRDIIADKPSVAAPPNAPAAPDATAQRALDEMLRRMVESNESLHTSVTECVRHAQEAVQAAVAQPERVAEQVATALHKGAQDVGSQEVSAFAAILTKRIAAEEFADA